MDKRNEAIKLLREWAREQVGAGTPKEIVLAHHGLATATNSLLQEFRTEFDVPGTRYWETYHNEHTPPLRSYHSQCLRELDPTAKPLDVTFVELKRHEYLSRQGIHGNYAEDSL